VGNGGEQRGASAAMPGVAALEPDVGDDEVARMEPAGRDCGPDLAPMERDRDVGVDGGARDLAGRRINARGQVDGDDVRSRGVDPLDQGSRLGARLAVEARAEERVDHDVVPVQVVRDLLRLATGFAKHSGGNAAVTPVRALPAHAREPCRLRERCHRLPRHHRPRALHQLADRVRVAGVALLGRAHLPGGVERLEVVAKIGLSNY
jgi:hypothetical protein